MTLTHSGASELSQLMEGTTAGALIPEIVRRGFQDLLEAEVSAAIGATRVPRQAPWPIRDNQVGRWVSLMAPRLSPATTWGRRHEN
ncbi:hypothetical protein KBY85_14325 [Cyanobium sp. BA5m-10]|uniref:hypothetical protein n=1 Tax=Cyanobium sp. BA5m-10 TaxID=2823705 RepID=UPI0020CF6A6C|nr:hypothetical protein [Cyanobium sp. BA5m-10]MCP9905302.1 hypothetical protein [Cyanobium sp. BA5m-10]